MIKELYVYVIAKFIMLNVENFLGTSQFYLVNVHLHSVIK